MIKKEFIYLNNELTSRNEIIKNMSEDVFKTGMINDVDTYVNAVLKREEVFPTTVGFNVSIPHGKSDAVISPFVTFMRTKEPIIWDENNKEKAQLIFMIGVPMDQKDKLHLKILAEISKNLMNENFRSSLLEAETVNEAYQLLKCIEENIYAEEMGNVK
ncbi:PTS sugar transporter subunit IIA [Metabacillus litoralis]|uniref:PTS sugar transporter subunit IIA n=1 Tax=Metabacillus litoralis TaxID=152268 RepID=UPI0013CEF740|nr:PTS sugar transporter subunit IIA [Metabacillus litoralis]